MGKVDENKQQKLDALFQSAYDLFLTKGIEKTSISDIVNDAGVAKGTFYLYFADKYEMRDRLISKTAGELFLAAHQAVLQESLTSLEDKIIFVVNYILDIMREKPSILRFISKNLSWGVFKHAVTKNEGDFPISVIELYQRLLLENPDVKLRSPETMLFLIIELASSASYSTILDADPISFEELRPYLNESIRAIIRNHVVGEM